MKPSSIVVTTVTTIVTLATGLLVVLVDGEVLPGDRVEESHVKERM